MARRRQRLGAIVVTASAVAGTVTGVVLDRQTSGRFDQALTPKQTSLPQTVLGGDTGSGAGSGTGTAASGPTTVPAPSTPVPTSTTRVLFTTGAPTGGPTGPVDASSLLRPEDFVAARWTGVEQVQDATATGLGLGVCTPTSPGDDAARLTDAVGVYRHGASTVRVYVAGFRDEDAAAAAWRQVALDWPRQCLAAADHRTLTTKVTPVTVNETAAGMYWELSYPTNGAVTAESIGLTQTGNRLAYLVVVGTPAEIASVSTPTLVRAMAAHLQ